MFQGQKVKFHMKLQRLIVIYLALIKKIPEQTTDSIHTKWIKPYDEQELVILVLKRRTMQ